MARKDYYEILGVGRDASEEEIKRAYKKLARKHHPDVNPGDADAEERFKEISEAYHVLGDEERRRQYDQVGPEQFAEEFDMSDFSQRWSRVFTGGGSRGGIRFDVGDLGGLFEELFGGAGATGGPGMRTGGRGDPRTGGRGGPRTGGRTRGARGGRPRPRKGRDVQVEVELGLEELLAGPERTVSYRSGSGERRRTRVRIPAHARDGQRIRIRGKGEPGSAGGTAGDLYLKVSLRPHPRFRLQGDDLHVDVPVTVYEAALGGRVEVPTLDGEARIDLPAGTRNGQRFRLGGRGAPGKDGDKGDLLARVRIELPEEIDEDVAELMRQFRERRPYDPRNGGGTA